MLLTKSCFNPALLRSDLRRCWPLLAGYTFLWFLILPLRMWNDVDPSPDDFLLQARSTAMEILGTSTTAAIWMNLISALCWPWPCLPICPALGAPTVCTAFLQAVAASSAPMCCAAWAVWR